eukprot:4023577-Pyramimonas_sp.AAC.1
MRSLPQLSGRRVCAPGASWAPRLAWRPLCGSPSMAVRRSCAASACSWARRALSWAATACHSTCHGRSSTAR